MFKGSWSCRIVGSCSCLLLRWQNTSQNLATFHFIWLLTLVPPVLTVMESKGHSDLSHHIFVFHQMCPLVLVYCLCFSLSILAFLWLAGTVKQGQTHWEQNREVIDFLFWVVCCISLWGHGKCGLVHRWSRFSLIALQLADSGFVNSSNAFTVS